MIVKKVTKLWKGRFVSVRDYEIEKGITEGGMCIKHNGEEMELTPDELVALRPTGPYLQSKFSGQYRLADIEWKPSNKQDGLFE